MIWPKRFCRGSVVLGFCPLLLAFSQPGGIAPQVSRLMNGLQIVVVPDSRERLVSVQVWFRVGSADDGDRYPGLCEMLRRRLASSVDVPASLRTDEARFESRTLRDACYFAWFLPGRLLDDALRVEADRFKILASVSRVTSNDIPAEDVEEFAKRWLVPGNATLLVTGDVQVEVVRDGADRCFGQLPWAEPPKRATPPPPKAERVQLPAVTGEYAGLDVTWVVPGAADAGSAALAVLMQRLGNAVDGPLCHRLMAMGCAPPHWWLESGRLTGSLTLSVDAEREPASELEAAIQEELARAARDIPTEIELNRARALAARAVRLEQANFADRALRLAFYEVVAGDVRLADWELPRTLAVTVGDLQRAAAELSRARAEFSARIAGPAAPVPAALIHGLDPGLAGPAQAVGDGVWVSVCPQPAAPVVEVRTQGSGTGELTGAMLALMSLRSPRLSAEQIRDYVSYHGLDLVPGVEGVRPALVSRGPVTQVAQMVELQADLIRGWPLIRAIDIVVTGPVEERAVWDAARAAWEGWRQPAEYSQ